MSEEYVPVTMVCADLTDMPEFVLPVGYSIRSYEAGDRAAWVAIQSAADEYNTITTALFDREFGSENLALLTARQLYLLDETGRAIGTSTAWFGDETWGSDYGRVHWVAIVPEFQGRGLAKPLMSATCLGLKAAGHERAYLTTAEARVAAISLYRKFGFEIV